jgi:hypothetical protein
MNTYQTKQTHKKGLSMAIKKVAKKRTVRAKKKATEKVTKKARKKVTKKATKKVRGICSPKKVSRADWPSDAKEAAKEALLICLERNPNHQLACETVGVPGRTFYSWLGQDPSFRTKYDAIRKLCTENLEKAVMHRAMEGVRSDKFYKDEAVGEEWKYSDVLLIAALKRADPEWREALLNKVILGAPKDTEITLNVHGEAPIVDEGEDDDSEE